MPQVLEFLVGLHRPLLLGPLLLGILAHRRCCRGDRHLKGLLPVCRAGRIAAGVHVVNFLVSLHCSMQSTLREGSGILGSHLTPGVQGAPTAWCGQLPASLGAHLSQRCASYKSRARSNQPSCQGRHHWSMRCFAFNAYLNGECVRCRCNVKFAVGLL